MRVAALYDIHGNLPALEAVLAELQEIGPHLVLVGGDVVLGPFPRETLEQLQKLGDHVQFIRGNTDRTLADEKRDAAPPPWPDRSDWTRAQLTEEERRFLSAHSDTAVIEVAGHGAVLFCHGSPRSDEEIITRATRPERLKDMLAGVEQRVVVCGHTHVQFDRVVDEVRLVNAGSVGMPYEDEPGAYWALFGPDVELRRTPYDVERAVRLIRATDYPDASEFAEHHVLSITGAAEATEEFERMASERD